MEPCIIKSRRLNARLATTVEEWEAGRELVVIMKPPLPIAAYLLYANTRPPC